MENEPLDQRQRISNSAIIKSGPIYYSYKYIWLIVMPFIVPYVLQRARNKQLDFISWTNKYPNVNQTVYAYRKLSNDPHCLIALTSLIMFIVYVLITNLIFIFVLL